MCPWSERTCSIPPEQVVGSSIVAKFEIVEGKPVGIHQHIGRRPILAFGNSESDIRMVQYTVAGEGLRLSLFLHHTDAEREYAYDCDSQVGALDQALDRAETEGWIVVDMKRAWKTVFPAEK